MNKTEIKVIPKWGKKFRYKLSFRYILKPILGRFFVKKFSEEKLILDLINSSTLN
jgi:hypothetical protein